MTKDDAVIFFGGASKLAKTVGVSKQAVGQWDSIPVARQYQIQVLSGGVLLAESAAMNSEQSALPQ